jgi:hypothetical protein
MLNPVADFILFIFGKNSIHRVFVAVQVEVKLRQTVGVRHSFGTRDQFLLFLDILFT